MADVDQIRTALRTSWHCGAGDLTPWSQRFCLVSFGVERYVATLVPAAQRSRLEIGLVLAARLTDAGLAAGAPVRTADGALTASVGEWVVALLDHVPGRPLDPDDPLDRMWWGSTLATAHSVLLDFVHPALVRMPVIRTDGSHLAVEDWVRPAVVAAVDAVTKLSVTDQLTYGVVHGGPAPREFRLDVDTGRTGLVDWSAAGNGPLVYDLACAVAWCSGESGSAELVDSYVSAGLVPADEVTAALTTMQRYHWAVRADHFARRMAAGGCDADRAGLRAAGDAMRALDGTA